MKHIHQMLTDAADLIGEMDDNEDRDLEDAILDIESAQSYLADWEAKWEE